MDKEARIQIDLLSAKVHAIANYLGVQFISSPSIGLYPSSCPISCEKLVSPIIHTVKEE